MGGATVAENLAFDHQCNAFTESPFSNFGESRLRFLHEHVVQGIQHELSISAVLLAKGHEVFNVAVHAMTNLVITKALEQHQVFRESGLPAVPAG